jgi:hypothetical protein
MSRPLRFERHLKPSSPIGSFEHQTTKRTPWMKITAPWRGVLIPGLVLLPGIAGAACETHRDSSGAYFATCRFRTNEKPPRVDELEVRFLRDTPRFILKLPDVTPFKYKYFVNGNSVDVNVDIRNQGDANTRETSVVVTLQVWDPSRSTQYGTDIEVTATVPVITPGAEARVFLTTVFLPNTIEDFDIVAAGFVDPPMTGQPAFGALYESDETNNAKMHACRVFGEDPVLIPTPPPVCN